MRRNAEKELNKRKDGRVDKSKEVESLAQPGLRFISGDATSKTQLNVVLILFYVLSLLLKEISASSGRSCLRRACPSATAVTERRNSSTHDLTMMTMSDAGLLFHTQRERKNYSCRARGASPA